MRWLIRRSCCEVLCLLTHNFKWFTLHGSFCVFIDCISELPALKESSISSNFFVIIWYCWVFFCCNIYLLTIKQNICFFLFAQYHIKKSFSFFALLLPVEMFLLYLKFCLYSFSRQHKFEIDFYFIIPTVVKR